MDIGLFIKKFITFFVEPYGIVFTLFALGLYLLFKRKESLAKLSLSLSFIFLFLFSYPPVSNYLITNLETLYPKYDYSQNVRYIHVLGNGHNVDPDQPLSSRISNAGVKRDLEGILIHLNTKNSKLIFTGYQGNTNIANAKINADFAMALGIKKENIIIGSKPNDTRQEAIFAKTIVGSEPFILVTSATHMPRAMMIFNSVGLNPIPAPTSFYKSEFDGYFKPPSVGDFYKSQIAVHEYIGILWSGIRG